MTLALGQTYRQPLGNCCSNDALPCILASEEVKDEAVKNPQAVKPQDDRSPAAQGTESLFRNVCKGPPQTSESFLLKSFLRLANG